MIRHPQGLERIKYTSQTLLDRPCIPSIASARFEDLLARLLLLFFSKLMAIAAARVEKKLYLVPVRFEALVQAGCLADSSSSTPVFLAHQSTSSMNHELEE